MLTIASSMLTGKLKKDRAYQMTQAEKDELKALMTRIKIPFDQRWEDLYHDQDPNEQAYGGRMIVTLADGSEVADEKTRANAHPGGDTPWQRPDYEAKLADYMQDPVSDGECARFIEAVTARTRSAVMSWPSSI